MNRRDTLKALGLAAAAGGALMLDSCGTKEAKKDAATAAEQLPGVTDIEHERNSKLAEEQFFTTHELATIGVLADIIIPADDVSGSATDAGVPDFIEFMVKDIPSYQTPIRGGLKWLDVQCQRRYGNAFAKCEAAQQLQLVDEIAYPAKAKPEMVRGVSFFNLMRDLTASGFFTSEIGVKDIGYVGNKPGVWDGVPEDVLEAHGFKSAWG
ncbi:MAG TPA: gluconate 2-dehydrogenase subunit 3 family protein [Parapedobacter sp.]|uniref:gluconate 2-dehydrogenase subunit 3 family protein n=1 Tax=Parapedobacter sp. TaxID=1958893 RepID=UPI002C6D3506|nr:gluconate 2-dehydrogenase subunit 3 family protein [Parapedobacter sp.]HWK59723.1 gluconate 2-dehydrogenase subunit 3 family protein [Parapedobacter sp.]